MKKVTILLVCLSLCHFYLEAQSLFYKELLFSGRNKELIQLIRNEVSEPEIVGDTARTLAQAYEGLLKHREAYTYYSRWLSRDSANVDALSATARMALQLGRIQEGENLYLRAYAIDSTNFNVGLQLAKLNYQLKYFEKALNYYDVLLMQDTTNVSLLVSVGDCLKEMGYLSAVNFYEEAVELNKENVSLAITLINTMLDFRQYAPPDVYVPRSMTVCDTALVYNPGNISLLRSKGVIHFLMKEYYACDSIMSGLIAAGDSTLLNFRYVSHAKYNQNLYFPAIPYMEYFYKIDTTNVEAAMLLGISLGRTYDRKRALSLFDHVEKLLQPAEAELYQLALQRGIVYQADRNFPAAASNYWLAAGLSEKNRIATLGSLVSLYPLYNARQIEEASPEQYARALFAYVAYLRAVREAPSKSGNDQNVATCQNRLSLFLEDMFFKNVDRLQMILPDGKKEWITREELEQLCK